MTYVFIREDTDEFVSAWDDDFYRLATELEMPSGRYTVYSTDLMPDQVKDPHKLIRQGKLKYITLLTRFAGA